MLSQRHLGHCAGIRRHLGDAVCRKSPITPEHLLHLLSQLDISAPGDANIWAAALVMFFAMLRRGNVLPNSTQKFDMAQHLRRQDVQFTAQGLVLSIRATKTIQFRERELIIPIPRIHGSPMCPTQAAYQAFKLTPKVPPSGPAFVVKDTPVQALSAGLFLKKVHMALERAKVPHSNISGHSFRRGGATWAYQSGISVDTIRIIGDWKSNAYTKYILPSTQFISQTMTLFSTSLPVE